MTAANPLPLLQEILAHYDPQQSRDLPRPGWTEPVVSYTSFTKQRNAKKRGCSVFLKFIPASQFTEDWSEDPIAPPCAHQNLYVGFSLQNGTLKGRYQASAVTHYLPVHALDDLIRLRNAIVEGRLFDHYLQHRYNTETPPHLSEQYRRGFFEIRKNHALFAHGIFDTSKGPNKEMEYSQLSVSYNEKTASGDKTSTPFCLNCMKMPRQFTKSEAGEDIALCWNSNDLTETRVRLTQQELLEMVEKTLQAVVHWLERHLGRSENITPSQYPLDQFGHI